MISSRILLESGSPDGIRLEDDTGVIILEASGPVTADQNETIRGNPVPSRKQRGFIEFGQSLLITTLAVVAVATVKTPQHQLPVLKKKQQQVEQYENRAILSGGQAPFSIEPTAQDPSRKRQDVGFAYGGFILNLGTTEVPRNLLFTSQLQKRRYDQVAPYFNALVLAPTATPFIPAELAQYERVVDVQDFVGEATFNLTAVFTQPRPVVFTQLRRPQAQQPDLTPNLTLTLLSQQAAPFAAVDFAQYERKFNNAPDPVPNALLIQWPFKPPDSGWSERKREYQQVEQQPNVFAYNNALSAPFIPVTWPEYERKRLRHQPELQQNQFAVYGNLEAPFIPEENGWYERKPNDHWPLFETSEFPAPFQVLGKPFTPVEFPLTGQARRDAQDYQQRSLDLVAMPFPSADLGYYARKKANHWPLFETSEFPAPFQILEEPFVPVDFPQTGQARRDAQDFQQRSLDLTAMPFPSWDVGYYERKDEYQQIDPEQNKFAFNNALEAPFIPELFENPYAKKPDAQDFVQFYFDAAGAFAPFTPVDFPQTGQARRDAQDYQQRSLDLVAMPFPSADLGHYARKKADHWPLFETSEFPAPFQVLERPFVPVDFPQTGQARRDAQDWSYQSLDLTAMPFPSADLGYYARKKANHWPLFETSEFPAPFQILEEPFVPVDFPQTGQARRDAQDFQQRSLDLTAMPFPSWDVGYYERKDEYQQIEQQPNPFAFRNALEAPFIPELFENPLRKRDEQDFIWFHFDTANAFNPFTPVDFPQTGQTRRDAQDFIGFYFDSANAFQPFVPVTWPEFQPKRDAQDYQQPNYFAFNNALSAPFTPATWPEFEKLAQYQDEQQPYPFVIGNALEAPFIPEAFENPYAKKPDAQDYYQRSLDLVAMPFPSADLGYYAQHAPYYQIDPEQNKFAFNNALEAPFIPEAFPNPEPRKLDAQDFILYFFDENNAFNPFVPVEFPLTGQARRDAQDFLWYYFDSVNAFQPFIQSAFPEEMRKREYQQVEQQPNPFAFRNALSAPFIPYDAAERFETKHEQQVEQYVSPILIQWPFLPPDSGWSEAKRPSYQEEQPRNYFALQNLLSAPFLTIETAQGPQRARPVAVEYYLNITGLYAASGVPFVPVDFVTPQVVYEVQDFTGGSLSLTAMPFASAELAQQPYAKPQQQVELFQYVLSVQIGSPFIPTENGWYEAKVPDHKVDEPQNLYPLHDVPVFDPFVPYEWPQTKQTKQDYEQQQYPSFTSLLLSRHPGVAFIVEPVNRIYIVEPQPRVYVVDGVDRVYIVVENARIYYAEPVDRTYEPED